MSFDVSYGRMFALRMAARALASVYVYGDPSEPVEWFRNFGDLSKTPNCIIYTFTCWARNNPREVKKVIVTLARVKNLFGFVPVSVIFGDPKEPIGSYTERVFDPDGLPQKVN